MKARILAAATKLFARDGVSGTSLQAVAQTVGIRKPSLLYHFPSKGDLRDTVLATLLAHWKDDLPRALAAAHSADDRLDAALTALMRFFLEEPDRARLLMREMLDRPEAMRLALGEHLQPWTALLLRTLELGQREGSVRADLTPSAFVLQLVTLGVGMVATHDVAGALLPTDVQPDLDTQVREFVRTARASLFVP